MTDQTPHADGPELRKSFEELTKDQMAIYAKELNDHFRAERKLRLSLTERNAELEQRAREVAGLNNILQHHLAEWYKLAYEYRDVLTSIKELLDEGMVKNDRTDQLAAMIDAIVAETEEASADKLLGVADD